LQIFLQQCLGVLAQSFRVDGIENRDVQSANHIARGIEAVIEKDGAEQGFQRIGQNRRPAETTRLQLTFAEPQELGQLQALCYFVQ